MIPCSCCKLRVGHAVERCNCSGGSCPNCLCCSVHCRCGASIGAPTYVYDRPPSWMLAVDGIGERTNMTYDAGPGLAPLPAISKGQMMHPQLEAAVKELAALRLPKICGYQFNVSNRIFLVGLVPGAWVSNAVRSRERHEVFLEVLQEITAAVMPVLDRHLPIKHWQYEWKRDEAFGNPDGVMIVFRWEGQEGR
jgi:hypothetical protein